MFDPSQASAKKALAATKKKAQETIKGWVSELLPDDVKKDVELIVCREFQCGDPKCAPIDTAIQIMFKERTRPPLQTGLPKESHMITREDVEQAVERMLNPPDEDEFDPISPAAAEVFEGIAQDIFTRLEPLGFPDKVGITQRLFSALDKYEQRVMQVQAAMQRQQQRNANPGVNMLLSYAQQNKPDEIQRLLDSGDLNPSEGNSVGQTALHVACLWGNIDAAGCLIANKASVNACNDLTGGTPLHIAISSPKALDGRLACAKALLEAGADPLLDDSRGMSPFAYASEGREPEMLELIRPFAEAAMAAAAEGGPGGVGSSSKAEEDDDLDDLPPLEGEGN